MSKSQPVTQTSQQTNSIPAWLTNAGIGITGQLGNLPQYSAYTGAGPAGLTDQQRQALGLASSNVGAGQGISMSAYNPLSSLTGFNSPMIDANSLTGASGVQGLMNPYIQNVVDAGNAAIDRNTAGAMNAADTSLGAQHAFGGSRQGVADAVTQNAGMLQKNQLSSNALQSGWNNALSAAQQAQQANQGAAAAAAQIRLQGANALAGLGTNIAGMNTQDLNNLLNAGGVAQNSQTAQNMFNYQNWMNNLQMPGQLLAQQAGILGSLPHDTTQTGSQSQMSYSNPLMQLGGLGLGLAGLGMGNGNTLGGSALSGMGSAAKGGLGALAPFLMMSDRRLKEDIEPIGSLMDDTPLYRFRYKGDPTTRVGVMADEVNPSDTVTHPSGYKMVDYARVVDRAARAR
jgi:Chaperone of endosialidase